MGRLRTVALALLVATGAEAGTLRVSVVDSRREPVVGAQVTLHPGRAAPHAWTSLTARTGLAVFTGVPPGRCRVEVERPGLAGVDAAFDLRPGDVLALRVEMSPEGETGRIAIEDRRRAAYGTTFDGASLSDLPSSGSAWSLLETAEAAAITDRIEGAGLFPGEPARVGIHGSSWTQTSYRLGDLDVTDPDRTGLPLLLPDLEAADALEVDTALAPAAIGPAAPTLTLVPRRPGSSWHGSAQAGFAGSGLQSRGFEPGPPPAARLGSAADAGVRVDGPLVRDRLGILLGGRFARARRLEGGDATDLRSRLGSGLAHLVFTPSARDEGRLLAVFQDVEQPYQARARFTPRDAAERDRFLHLQGTWERHAPDGLSWSVFGGYQRGHYEPRIEGRTPAPVDRLLDGPVPELVFPAQATRERYDLGLRLTPDLRGLGGGRHEVRFEAAASRGAAVARPAAGAAPIPELVGGLPARVWDYGYPGPDSRRHVTALHASIADRIALPGRLELEAGLRFEAQHGAAEGGDSVSWRALSPRAFARWRATEGGGLALFGGWGRYRERLPLSALAFGDPAAPQGSVYRWLDANGDRQLQADEIGPLVARVGPGSADGRLASIDPALRPPVTDEVVLGFEVRFGPYLFRFASLHRRERDLVESVDVGVPASSYSVRLVPDPGGDLVGHEDDQLLPVYDRDPGSFGQDRYLLTNPADHTTLYEGAELTLEKAFGDRFRMRLGATASRSEDYGGNRGFRVVENDQGVIGEQFDTPNAVTFGRGRLFFDRAYTIKLSGSYRAPGDLRLGVIARYQDGQPFARVVIAPDLAQGPEAVQAVPNGRHRLGYNLTLDARIEKGLRVGPRRLAAVLEGFNLLDVRREMEEDVRTGPSFRQTTLVQPPRALCLGFRVDF